MKIGLGCDEAGLPLMNVIRDYLNEKGIEVDDFGVYKDESVLYPDIAEAVANSVASERNERAILICGTGIGMSITANKIPGVRAALCHDTYSAARARKSNDAQVLTMGARVVGSELAKQIVDSWLTANFEEGRSTPKVARMKAIDEDYRKTRR